MAEYDPLDYQNIIKSVVDAMLAQPLVTLTARPDCAGAGIYAIYYAGPFEAYAPIASGRPTNPIYVGKAIPPGRRKGTMPGDGNQGVGQSLANRLGEHAESIQQTTLRLSDFLYRALPVKDVWIPLAEQALIQMFRPVWNLVVDGFGNHDPGAGRTSMMCPRWDTLHPGRTWAARLRQQHQPDQIINAIREHFRSTEAQPGS